MSMFFSSRKTVLKSLLDISSIASYLSSFLSFFLSQSRQHLDTWWINRASSCLLDSFSTPGRSIELLFLIRYFCSSIPTSVDEHFLDTYLDKWFDTSRHLICRDLLRIYLSFLMRSDPHFSWSISWWLSVFSPKHSHLTQILFLKVSSSFFKIFFSW